MSQTIPASAQLGFAYVGATGIGVRTVRLDKTTVVTATTTSGVAEAPASSGQFQRAGGIEAHDEGGYIVWTHNGTDILWGGIPAAGASQATIDSILDEIEALGASGNITVISVVTGSTVTVRRNDTWAFTMTLAGVSLTSYEAVAFVVKRSANQPDDDALLYVRSDDGLIRIGGTEPPGGSSGGSLTVDSATQFTGLVNMTLTAVTPGQYTWWLKCFDITPTPDEGYTLAEGVFVVENYGLRAVA